MFNKEIRGHGLYQSNMATKNHVRNKCIQHQIRQRRECEGEMVAISNHTEQQIQALGYTDSMTTVFALLKLRNVCTKNGQTPITLSRVVCAPAGLSNAIAVPLC